jgi:hypothetical protein
MVYITFKNPVVSIAEPAGGDHPLSKPLTAPAQAI